MSFIKRFGFFHHQKKMKKDGRKVFNRFNAAS